MNMNRQPNDALERGIMLMELTEWTIQLAKEAFAALPIRSQLGGVMPLFFDTETAVSRLLVELRCRSALQPLDEEERFLFPNAFPMCVTFYHDADEPSRSRPDVFPLRPSMSRHSCPYSDQCPALGARIPTNNLEQSVRLMELAEQALELAATELERIPSSAHEPNPVEALYFQATNKLGWFVASLKSRAVLQSPGETPRHLFPDCLPACLEIPPE